MRRCADEKAPIVNIHTVVLAFGLLAGFWPATASQAQTVCAGHDLIAGLDGADSAALDSAVAAAPYASGNHWRATKADSTLDIIGTFHLFDPRMSAHMATLVPVLRDADAVYLEATDAEIEQLQKAISTRPELMFTQGATLPERLSEDEWRALAAEMDARGIPAFLASKFQPWYVSVILAMPPCAMSAMTAGSNGMDQLVLKAAKGMGIPAYPLEPYDTVFQIFGAIKPEDQLDMIRMALPQALLAEDMLATVTESYFREEHRQIWEFSRQAAIRQAGDNGAKITAEFAVMEELLVTSRNRRWVELILREAPGKSLVIAVGAGHLAGEAGVLRLLESAGYRLERAEF